MDKENHKCNCDSFRGNPWMGVSILLAVLFLVSFFSNLYMMSRMDGTGSRSDGNLQVPTQQPVVPSVPTAPTAPTQAAPVAVSADDDPTTGTGKVVIIEFSDFQCPFCKRFNDDALAQIKKQYVDTGKAKLVFRDYPLSFHPEAQKAAEAAECADDQGKFWAYHDKLFANQATLSVTNYKAWAKELGLNTATFDSCLDTGKHAAEVQKDFQDGQAAGVSGTPTIFVNGIKIVGAQPFSAFQSVIDAELAK